MKRFFNYLILTMAVVFSTAINAQTTESTRAILERGRELLTNPGWESGKTGWTASGATFAHVTSGSNLLTGAGSATINMSTGGDYVQSALFTVPNGLAGGPCQVRIATKGGDGTDKMQVLDNNDLLIGETTILGDTGKRDFTNLYFPCPSSGSIRMRILATQNSSIFAIDDAHLGGLITGYDVAQARYLGSISWAATANCNWTLGGTGSVASFSADSDCPTPTLKGVVKAPGTKIPAIVLPAGSPKGQYVLRVKGYLNGGATSGDNANTNWYLGDGVTDHAASSSGINVTDIPDQVVAGVQIADISVSSALTVDTTYQLRFSMASGSGRFSSFDVTGIGAVIEAYYFPDSTDQVKTYNTAEWKVDANLAGGNPDLGSSSVTSYTEVVNSSLTMVQNTGSLSVGVPCSTTNTGSVGALTCSVGSESVGVTYNQPSPGTVLACASFGHSIATGAGGSAYATFQLVETPANAQTILQEGKSRITGGTGTASSTVNIPWRVCGTFNFTSAGQKTLRLMAEITAGGTVSTNVIGADAGSTLGQRDIHIEVYPIGQQVPAPIVSGPYENVVVQTGAYTALPSDRHIRGDATGGAFTFTLLSAVGNTGLRLRFTKIDSSANAITVASVSSQVIGPGSATSTILHEKGETFEIMSNGTNWEYTSNMYRTTKAVTNCDAGSAITSQEGSWLTSVGNIASGECLYTFIAGRFAATPRCFYMPTVADKITWATGVSTSGVTIDCTDGAGVACTTHDGTLMCEGPR